MIEGERFDEFSVLWLLLHASRFQHPNTGSCVLDDWKQKAEESGERVLGALRGGVQSALESLGWGFLNHPANGALREALQSGQLSRQQFHEQLLRLVYRFLFLFTAEDRDLLFPRELKADDPRRRIYREGYSVSRLRELAIKRSAYEGEYGDLWELQRLVFQQLSIGNSPLGLPGLGGLFSLEQCPDLQAAELWNGPLLRAIKAIGWFDAGGSFTRVRYRDLNTEELGSVYEGLLELHPQLEQQGSQWQLSYGGGAGSDRKTTGSYYTPDALVQELIKSALIPVIDDRLSKAHGQAEQEQALLNIKVIDPACGSGHFLLAAARRLAVALAQVRAGDDQPSEDDRQHALRDVVTHCIYAVDRNPMAVELCKVALWIEAIDPGKPLSFLDAHIQCGDSLVGVFDPKVLEEGIPDEAYKPLTGDDKTVCSSLKKENAAARKTISRGGSNRGIQGSLDLSGTQPRSQGQQALQAIEAMPETTLAETAAKQAAYAKWQADRGQDLETLAADLYTAAFFLAKTSDSRATVPTTQHLLKLLADQPVEEVMEEAVVQSAREFHFFHWHLRFGEVMAKGGFDCVLGNPPWDMLQLDAREFFSNRCNDVSKAPTTAARERAIKALSTTNLALYQEYNIAKLGVEGTQSFVHGGGRFPLTSFGRINLAPLFSELTTCLIANDGIAGIIVPSGLLTDSFNKHFCQNLFDRRIARSAFDFENKNGIFPSVHRSYRFLLLTLGRASGSCAMASFAHEISDIKKAGKTYYLSPQEISIVNPNSKTCPVFRTAYDKELTVSVYNANQILQSDIGESAKDKNPYFLHPTLQFMMNTDSKLFSTREEILAAGYRQDTNGRWVSNESSVLTPLYEAKLISTYNFRAFTYESRVDGRGHRVLPSVSTDDLMRSDFFNSTYYFVDYGEAQSRIPSGVKEGIAFGFRDVTTASAERTVVGAFVPFAFAAGNNMPLIYVGQENPRLSVIALGALNSLPLDYIARQKVGGLHLNFYILKQLPLPKPGRLMSMKAEILERIISLTATPSVLEGMCHALEVELPGFEWDETKRAVQQAELDAIYANLYGIDRDKLAFILDPSEVFAEGSNSETFRILKEKEISEFGEFRTRRLVLEAWDRLFGG